MTTDLTLYGAGILGLSIAWEALGRGARVTVIDPHGPGAGASGGLVGALAPHVPENWNEKKAFQLDSLLAAPAFWSAVAAASAQDPGYSRAGRLQPIADAAALDLALARAESAATLWGTAARWSVEPAPAAWAPASPTGQVIRDTLSAHIHPRRAIDALAGAITARGGRIVAEAAERGTVIHATGARGLDELSAALGHTIGQGIKGQAALLDHAAPGAPQLFADGLHIIPHLDGTTAIGSTTERDYADPAATDTQLDDVIARARAAVPALAGARVLSRWAGLRPRARSRAPLLGAWPDRPGHFVANGGFKIGFGMAPGIARVMADMVLDGRDWVPEGFRVAASRPKGP